jgi:hypothetical protein
MAFFNYILTEQLLPSRAAFYDTTILSPPLNLQSILSDALLNDHHPPHQFITLRLMDYLSARN